MSFLKTYILAKTIQYTLHKRSYALHTKYSFRYYTYTSCNFFYVKATLTKNFNIQKCMKTIIISVLIVWYLALHFSIALNYLLVIAYYVIKSLS